MSLVKYILIARATTFLHWLSIKKNTSNGCVLIHLCDQTCIIKRTLRVHFDFPNNLTIRTWITSLSKLSCSVIIYRNRRNTSEIFSRCHWLSITGITRTWIGSQNSIGNGIASLSRFLHHCCQITSWVSQGFFNLSYRSVDISDSRVSIW